MEKINKPEPLYIQTITTKNNIFFNFNGFFVLGFLH